MAFDPQQHIPDLSGKVVLVTGGELSIVPTTRICINRVYLTNRQQQVIQD
jgi:hypothetical protein